MNIHTYIHRCENVHGNTTECELWALRGTCNSNPGYMIAQCTRTCLGCGLKDPGTFYRLIDFVAWGDYTMCPY